MGPTETEERLAQQANDGVLCNPDDVARLLGIVASERAARQQVEAGLERERQERCKAEAEVQRLLAADAEHSTRWIRAREERKALEARCERAEADNAALVEALSSVVWRNLYTVDDDAVHDSASAVCSAPHPGTALLERLRALEEGIRVARRGGEWIQAGFIVYEEEANALFALVESKP